MAPSKKTIEEIAALAATLNKETEELNSLVGHLEQQLGNAKIGVSVWADVTLDCRESVGNDDGGNELKTIDAWDLGYAKVDKEWRIAAKQRRGIGLSKDFEGNFDWVDMSAPIPLVKAPRGVRVEAAACLDGLLAALQKRMAEFIKNIRDAKKLTAE
jgi:hypothetical protein